MTPPLEICLESPHAKYHMGVYISKNFPEFFYPPPGLKQKISLWRKK